MRHLLIIFVLLSLLAPSNDALAHPMVKKAEQLYKDLEYRTAADLLQRALGQSGLTTPDRVEIYRLLGLCKAILNQRAQAKAAFLALLDLRPDFKLDLMTTPRALRLFREVQAAHKARPKREIEVRSISMSHVAPARAEPGLPLTLKISVRDPKRLTRTVTLHYRRLGQSDFTTLAASKKGQSYQVTINGLKVIAPRLEYFFAATGDESKVLAGVGQASLPLRIAVEKEKIVTTTPVYKKWWFWTIIGGAVAGATAGIVVGVTSGGGTVTPPPVDTVDVTISFQ